MTNKLRLTISKPLTRGFQSVTALLATLTLTGCYVEVGHELAVGYDTDVTYSTDITQFSTQQLVDTAVTPFVLAAESAEMIANPDAYTTPRTRNLARAVVIETTYASLFDDWNCDYGGYTEVQATANTSSDDDGYTYVDIELSSQAHHCEVMQRGTIYQIDSDLNYDVTGWYDDWGHQLSSVDGDLKGEIFISYRGKWFEHDFINMQIRNVSASDLMISGSSRIELSDGYYEGSARLVTSNNVHLYRGDDHPYYGNLRLNDGYYWVELSFDDVGVLRHDSNGYSYYQSWSALGY